jgi:hypothetical protein
MPEMPIYAPKLPPSTDLSHGQHPAMVIARFDFMRIRRQKMGIFFALLMLVMLLIKVSTFYVKYLLNSSEMLAQGKSFFEKLLPQGAAYQAEQLDGAKFLLWFLMALWGGGLIARDTLYRVRPLMYAHPLRPLDYLSSKLGLSTAIPFVMLLPFALIPWALSMAVAGANGPLWAWLPLRLIPAAFIIALLMGAVSLGASSLASTPRAGIAWMIGIVLGLNVPVRMAQIIIFVGTEGQGDGLSQAIKAISPMLLADAWPQLLCGAETPVMGWAPAIIGTLAHVVLWTWIAARRTQPSEAVL